MNHPAHDGSPARDVDLPGAGEPTFPVVDGQRGLATSAQLRGHGWSADRVRHARGRTIQRVFPQVYAPHQGPLSVEDRLIAAYLWAGDSAVLTGRVALQRHGLNIPSNGTCLFLVPASHRARQVAGVETARTTREIQVASFRDCVAMTDVARALCVAASRQGLTGADLRAAVIAALQRRLTHPDRLRTELAQRPTNGLRLVGAALKEFCAGAWSLPESTLATLVSRDPELPDYLLNVDLINPDNHEVLGVPDGYFPSCGVALQVHSRRHHSGVDARGTDRWSVTVEKDGAMIEHNIIVMPITPSSIDKRPTQTLARIRRVVEANLGRTLPNVLVRQRDSTRRTARPAKPTG